VLAEAARDAGVDLREDHTVVGVEEHTDHVRVEVRGPDGVERHEARMVAGCDGPNSRVRRELDLPEPDELLHGVLGFDPEPDHGEFVDVHLTVPEFSPGASHGARPASSTAWRWGRTTTFVSASTPSLRSTAPTPRIDVPG